MRLLVLQKDAVIKACFRTFMSALRCTGQVQAMLTSSANDADVKRERCERQVGWTIFKKILVQFKSHFLRL